VLSGESSNDQDRDMADTIHAPIVKAHMLIRRPVADVFEALVDPSITSRFWFSKSSGRLKPGAHLRWDWEMYGVFTEVDVRAIEENKRILIEWNGPDHPSAVEWTFEPRGEDRTFVTVENRTFYGEPDAVVAAAIDSMGGFSLLLAALKAFLEHGIELNVVVDHSPDALIKGWAATSERVSKSR
jgi:uncharacterized protein YndB with AHSA1/START domain